MQTYSHRWNAKGIKEYKDDDEDKLPSRTNSLGIHVIGGNQRMPKKHRKEYVSTDAYFGPHGHYYLGGRRRRIGAGFGRRRRTRAPSDDCVTTWTSKDHGVGILKGVIKKPCDERKMKKKAKENAKKKAAQEKFKKSIPKPPFKKPKKTCAAEARRHLEATRAVQLSRKRVLKAVQMKAKACAASKAAETKVKSEKKLLNIKGPTFQFKADPCSSQKLSDGSFNKKLVLNQRVNVGVIPSGQFNVKVEMKTDK